MRFPRLMCGVLTAVIFVGTCIAIAADSPDGPPVAAQRDADWHRRMLVFLGPDDFDRTVIRAGGSNVLHFTEPLTDIGISAAAHSRLLGPPDVHLPPRLVCGEGAEPGNGTLVRVLSRYQVLEEQFAAFSPDVRGGVHVTALHAGDRPLIAAVPAADPSVRAVRLFDEHGSLVHEVAVPADMPPPFRITTGRFQPASTGKTHEQVAVMSRDRRGDHAPVVILGSDGTVVGRVEVPLRGVGQGSAAMPTLGTTALATWHGPEHDALMIWSQPANALTVVDLTDRGPGIRYSRATIDLEPAETTIHPSAFTSRELVCGANEDCIASRLNLVSFDGRQSRLQPSASLDIGRRENCFFGKRIQESAGFVTKGGYGPPEHAMICPAWGVVRTTGDAAVLESDDPAVWIPATFGGAAPLERAGLLFPFWSHWHNSWFGNRIGDIVNPATGFSKYNVLDERNTTHNDGSTFKGSLSIERQLLLASRVYFWLSAASVRGPGRDAEQLIGATSIHELGSPLDYNPGSITGFRRHLTYRWGDVGTMNRRFGTAFSSFAEVDPPRGMNRGAWDAVGGKDPAKEPGSDFFHEWRDYNKLVVLSARWMDATRDGLLAGFAPELMKNHRPGFGKDLSAAGLTMGTSTGGSVYSPLPGVDAERIIVTGPNSSGQWNFSYGEYGAGEEFDYEYVRLKWQWKQGLITVNNAPHHGTVEAMLAADGERRPGQTGGVGEVRAVALPGGERFDIAQIGVGPDRNGLLKSIREDGGFEGSTYVVPFHAKVLTVPLLRDEHIDAGRTIATPTVETFSHNDQFEVVIDAKADASDGLVRVALQHEGVRVPASEQTFAIGSEPGRLRYCVRGGMRMRDAAIVVSTERATARVTAAAQLEQVARHGRPAGIQHRGGVSFDLLDRECMARRPLPTVSPIDRREIAPEAAVADTAAPVWLDPEVMVRFPLDDEIKAVGWMPCIDPDYRVWLTVRGATDNDTITRYSVTDAASGAVVMTTPDAQPTFRLPPLAPLRAMRLEVHAFDRAGNRSATAAVASFTTPGVFDFGPEPTTSRGDVTFVGRNDRYDEARGYGWKDTARLTSRHAGWGRNTLTSCIESAEGPTVFRIRVPAGAYRVVPLVGTPEKSLRSRFSATAGDVRLDHYVRDWTTSVEPLVAQAANGMLDITLPARHRLFGLVVTPAADTTPPRWKSAAPTVLAATYDCRLPENPRLKGTHLFDRTALSLSWPAATDDTRVRHYKVLVNEEVWQATNLTTARLRGLPVDRPLTIRVTAADDAGNVAVSDEVATELDSRTTGTVLLSCKEGTTAGGCEVWLNGVPVEMPSPRTSRGLPVVVRGRFGRNVLCVRLTPAGSQPVSIIPEMRFGDRLFDATAAWRMSTAVAGDEPGWLDADFHAAGWAATTTLKADSPTGYRLEFDIAADAPRGALAVASIAARVTAIEASLDSIVIQQLDFHDALLKDVVATINRELPKVDQSGFNIRLMASPRVGDLSVTLLGTNRSLRTVLADLGRDAGLAFHASADGTLTLAPDQGGTAPTSE